MQHPTASTNAVIPAKAGSHRTYTLRPLRRRRGRAGRAPLFAWVPAMGPRFRGDDGKGMGRSLLLIAAVTLLAACAPKQEAAETPPTPELVPAAAPGAPVVSVQHREDMTSLPLPYDEAATPGQVSAMIDAAYERAKVSGKRVVIDFGGNWCSWCRGVAGVMDLPEVKPFVEKNFEIVYVPINIQQGAIDRNQHVFTRLNLPATPDHYPWMVVTEADGAILHSSYDITRTAIGNATPQSWVNWLAQYAKAPASAEARV
jgi:thiol-disulfide isomerase/thioredoxin